MLYKWVTGVIALLIEVITPFISGSGPYLSQRTTTFLNCHHLHLTVLWHCPLWFSTYSHENIVKMPWKSSSNPVNQTSPLKMIRDFYPPYLPPNPSLPPNPNPSPSKTRCVFSTFDQRSVRSTKGLTLH